MSTQLERRPLLLALAALAIGIGCREQFLVLFLAFALIGLARSVRSWSIILSCLISGYLISPESLPVLSTSRYESGPARILTEGEDRFDSVQSIAKVGDLQVLISAPPATHLHPGEWIGGPFMVASPSEALDALDREQGIQGKVQLHRVQFLNPPLPFFALADRVKDDFRSFIDSATTPEEASWMESLWLRGGSLPKADRDQLATSGAYSLVAASGLHVFVLWGMITFLLGTVFHIDRKIQITVVGFALVLYCLITGLHETTVRAGLTCLVFSSAYLFGREPDLISITSFCGILYLLFFPRLLPTLGFQLSMIVPLSLGFYLSRLSLSLKDESRSLIRDRLRHLVAVLLVVFFSAQPLVAFHTGQLSFGLVLSSLGLTIVAPVTLAAVLVAYFLKLLIPTAALGLLKVFVVPLASGLRESVSWISGVAPTFTVPPFSALWLLAYFGLWLLLWRPHEVPA